jgi:hypothetical protein
MPVRMELLVLWEEALDQRFALSHSPVEVLDGLVASRRRGELKNVSQKRAERRRAVGLG